NRPQGRNFRKVAAQHGWSRHEGLSVYWIRASRGSLVATEEEQLDANNRPASSPAILIALERAVLFVTCSRIHCCEVFRGVEQIVAHKFECIAVELVRPGLGHRVHLGAPGQTLRGCKAVRLHLKFLQRVWKWKRQT